MSFDLPLLKYRMFFSPMGSLLYGSMYPFGMIGLGSCIWNNSSKILSTCGDTFTKSASGNSTLGNAKIPYKDLILKYSKKYNVDAALICAVIKNESNFQKNAKSHCGAQGLMQLMPSTAKSYGVKNPWDPEQNIEGGVKMLSELLKKFNGKIDLVAAAYNAGPNRKELKEGKIPNIKETKTYVARVTASYKEYKKLG